MLEGFVYKPIDPKTPPKFATSPVVIPPPAPPAVGDNTEFIELLPLPPAASELAPNYVGYKGRLQYIADALKLFIKGVIIPHESNKF